MAGPAGASPGPACGLARGQPAARPGASLRLADLLARADCRVRGVRIVVRGQWFGLWCRRGADRRV
jgi:hypothetical protein